MTALNCIRQSNLVSIICDGASFDGGAHYVGPAVKAWPIAHCNAVVGIRGPRAAAPILADVLSALTSYETIKQSIAEIVKETEATARPLFQASPGGGAIEVVVAGFTVNGPDSYCVASHAGFGFPAWTIVPLGPVAMLPGDPVIAAAVKAALPARISSADELDAERDGLTILECQRAARIAAPGETAGTRHRLAGGFAQIFSITSDRISTWILRRWDDQVGKPIDPISRAA